jgi:hypothetical protein
MDELINTLENLRSQLDIPDLSSSEFAIKIKNDITLDLYFYDLNAPRNILYPFFVLF